MNREFFALIYLAQISDMFAAIIGAMALWPIRREIPFISKISTLMVALAWQGFWQVTLTVDSPLHHTKVNAWFVIRFLLSRAPIWYALWALVLFVVKYRKNGKVKEAI